MTFCGDPLRISKRSTALVVSDPSMFGGRVSVNSMIPSGTLERVADHRHNEVTSPSRYVLLVPSMKSQPMEPSLIWGTILPLEDDTLNDNAEVTPSHDISTLNSKAMSTLLLFPAPCAVAMRASWPGENLVIIGRGPTHISCGTRALKENGFMVIEERQPRYGGFESL